MANYSFRNEIYYCLCYGMFFVDNNFSDKNSTLFIIKVIIISFMNYW